MDTPPPPLGSEKIRRNLQVNFVSAPPAHQVHPQAEQESIVAGRGIFGRIFSSFTPCFEGDD